MAALQFRGACSRQLVLATCSAIASIISKYSVAVLNLSHNCASFGSVHVTQMSGQTYQAAIMCLRTLGSLYNAHETNCCVLLLQGENAWVFVNEDDIPDTVKHWHAFSTELEKEAKAAAPKGQDPPPPTTLSCVVMDNKYLSPAEVREM